jgi:hypothetical protein
MREAGMGGREMATPCIDGMSEAYVEFSSTFTRAVLLVIKLCCIGLWYLAVLLSECLDYL